MNFKEQKLISEPLARRLLRATESEWKQLVAEGFLDLSVRRSTRGAEVRTSIHSLERASARLQSIR